MKTVYMFPGQGAQAVGMARDLLASDPEAAGLFARASAILGYDLAALCLNGPEEQLNRTDHAQPAIFVHSAAALTALRAGRLAGELAGTGCDACAGLSLGEYSALYAAGAMSFEDGVRLVQLRGQSMQAAAGQRAGTMVSMMGMDDAAVDRLCQAVLAEGIREEDGLETILAPVNYNCPGQIVVSGSLRACGRAAELAESMGASRAIPLKVAGAFHTAMMAPAADRLRQALARTPFGAMNCPVVANVDARPYAGSAAIAEGLLSQLVSAVRWQQSVEALLSQGAQRFVEIGPGRVLNGLVKKISRPMKKDIEIINIG